MRPNFGCAIDGKKASCRKRRKSSLQEENNVVHPTMIGLGFVIKIVKDISPSRSSRLGWLRFKYDCNKVIEESSKQYFEG
jgi:hypothetical protein